MGDPAQAVRFCTSTDGVQIAYAVHGSGPPLVVSTCWFSHLQHDWESPVWRHFLDDLGRIATVVRFDERGSGRSDRDVSDFSLEARTADLAAVCEAAGFERFALMAMSQGGGPSINYAVEHPERVTRMLFYCSAAAILPDPTSEDLELNQAFLQLITVGYARPESTFRRVFTSMMIPAATEEQMRWLDDLQRWASTADSAYRLREALTAVDVRHLLPRIQVKAFLAADRGHGAVPRQVEALSAREREVLLLAADGHGNDEIAASLHLSVRTVERHLHNAYAKLGVSGRSARAAAVGQVLLSG